MTFLEVVEGSLMFALQIVGCSEKGCIGQSTRSVKAFIMARVTEGQVSIGARQQGRNGSFSRG